MSGCLLPLEDNEHGAICGDEGRFCPACMAQATREHEYLKHVSKYTVMPIDEEYYQELRDAGRL
jgi:hypothetical protein